MTTAAPTPKEIRAELQRIGYATVEDSYNWTYFAVRPCQVPPTWRKGQKVKADCSKSVQFHHRWSGAPDPMESDWSEWGNSQTLWLKLDHIDHPIELRIGDIVTFGHDGEDHAAWVIETGPDPLLHSDGHKGAPNTYRLSADTREHQLLLSKIPNDAPSPPAPSPTPAVKKLRAKTGWFAWVAWRQGEGAWKSYGKANKLVRPNVKKLVPLSWWKRYAKFLKNRKRAN